MSDSLPVSESPLSTNTVASTNTATNAATCACICTVNGPFSILDRVSKLIGLESILQRIFPAIYMQILSLAYFLVQKGLPLSRAETWSTSHKHPFGNALPSQRVSELLHAITESDRQAFFSAWMAHLAETECFVYDITSVSSYSVGNEYVCWGYNRDGEKLPQINMAMLYGQGSGLPAYYRRLPGNISDVSTLQTTINSLNFIGQCALTFVMDRGFYSKTNINALLNANYNFVIACPKRKWVEELFEKHHDELLEYQNSRILENDEVMYMITKQYQWDEHMCYAHIYFSNVKAAEEKDKFARKLAKWKNELKMHAERDENEWAYKKYFVVTETAEEGRIVSENNEAINAEMKKQTGFFCILTKQKMDAAEILDLYRKKECVENCFDDLKNTLDMKRLRMHSSAAADAKMFLQFIAAIILSKIRAIKNQDSTLKNMSIREIMEAMETISEIKLPNSGNTMFTETGKIQREIAKTFGVNHETWLQ